MQPSKEDKTRRNLTSPSYACSLFDMPWPYTNKRIINHANNKIKHRHIVFLR